MNRIPTSGYAPGEAATRSRPPAAGGRPPQTPHREETVTHPSSSTASTAALLALGLAAAASSPASAQYAENRIDLEARAGIGLPAFDLAERADPGPAVGLELAYRLSERVSLVAGGDVELLEGASGAGPGPGRPGLTAWHYAAGLELGLLDPGSTYWRLDTGAGLGGSTYDAEGGRSRSAFSLYGSLELGYEVSPEADLFLGVRSWLAFAEQELEALPGPDGPSDDPLAGVDGAAWSFPVMAGVRLRF